MKIQNTYQYPITLGLKKQNNKNTISNNNQPKINNSNATMPYYMPSFGLHNPKAALYRAKNLQTEYAKQGINYLLPDKVWSTKKIMSTVHQAMNKFDELTESGEISAQSLNKTLSEMLPKNISEKIQVGDIVDDYPKYLRGLGYTDKQIAQRTKQLAGVSIPEKDKVLVFMPLYNAQFSLYNKLFSKKTFGHELKHALTNEATNIHARDFYKLNNPNLRDDVFKIFHTMERTYQIADELYLRPVKLDEETFIKSIKNAQTNKSFNSIMEFFEDFKKTWNENIKNEKSFDGVDKKIITSVMQHFSRDEKEAYTTTNVMRKCNWNSESPVGAELNTIKYKHFENFFKKLGKE